MGCSPAPSCRAVLDQASARWSGRNRASDGICGDSSHQARKSDHNVGNAVDLTHDPAHGVDAHQLARTVFVRDRRVKYLISNGQIWNPAVSPHWRRYTGSNPHSKHAHISIHGWARNDTRSWFTASAGGEDEMNAQQEQRLINVEGAVARIEKAFAYNSRDGLDPAVEQWTPLGQRVENIEAAVARIEQVLTAR